MPDDLASIFEGHAYFACCLIGLCIVLVGYFAAKQQRRMMLISGLAALLQGPLAVSLVGEYWNPNLLIGQTIGVEDFLFVFCGGSMTWFMATWPFRNRLIVQIDVRMFLRRYIGVALFAVTGFIIGGKTGLGPMTCLLILYILALGIVLTMHSALWPVALSGALISTIVYVLIMRSFLLLFPELTAEFNGWNHWGPRIFGLPIEEFVTICSASAATPTVAAFAANARLLEHPQKSM